jgi:hypothetical protein
MHHVGTCLPSTAKKRAATPFVKQGKLRAGSDLKNRMRIAPGLVSEKATKNIAPEHDLV